MLFDRQVLIAPNGEEFPCSFAAHYKRWAEKEHDAVASARHHLVWPRTTKDGLRVTVVKSSTQRFNLPTPNTFRISGQITNQRGAKDRVVVRVMRNSPAKHKRHRQAEFTTHLLFLKGRLSPAKDFVNHHVTLVCALEGREIAIRKVLEIGQIEEQVVEFKGVKFPWPFASSRASIERLAELNGKAGKQVIVQPGFRIKLAEQIERWKELQKFQRTIFKKTSDADRVERDSETGEYIMDKETGKPRIEPELPNREQLERDNDRLRLILRRIESFTKRMKDGDLEVFLEDTALLSVLKSPKRSFLSGTPFHPFGSHRPATKSEAEEPAQPSTNTPMPVATKAPPKATTSTGKVKIMHLLPEEMRDFAMDALRGMNDSGLATKHGIYSQTVRIWANVLVNSGWLAAVPEHLVKQIRSHQILKAAGIKKNK